LVSAAGFEPATHASKDHKVWVLPRILNHLRLPQTLPGFGSYRQTAIFAAAFGTPCAGFLAPES